jgi:predicted metal-dependent hydrolase
VSTVLGYLQGYPPDVLARVAKLQAEGQLEATVQRSMAQRYGQRHTVITDGALYDYVTALKSEYLRRAEPIAKVAYDAKLKIIQQALGTHTTVSRVQGNKLKAKREIRIATLFKQAPAAFLRMIVVHELAHLKEREHGRAFYALCESMEPSYHQLEFDLRLWLTIGAPTLVPDAAAEG